MFEIIIRLKQKISFFSLENPVWPKASTKNCFCRWMLIYGSDFTKIVRLLSNLMYNEEKCEILERLVWRLQFLRQFDHRRQRGSVYFSERWKRFYRMITSFISNLKFKGEDRTLWYLARRTCVNKMLMFITFPKLYC